MARAVVRSGVGPAFFARSRSRSVGPASSPAEERATVPRQSMLLGAAGLIFLVFALWDTASGTNAHGFPLWVLPVGVAIILLTGAAATLLWGVEEGEGTAPSAPGRRHGAGPEPLEPLQPAAWAWAEPESETEGETGSLETAASLEPWPPAEDVPAGPETLPIPRFDPAPTEEIPYRSRPRDLRDEPGPTLSSTSPTVPRVPASPSPSIDPFFREGGVCSECLGDFGPADPAIPCRECGQPLCARCASTLARAPEHLRCGHVIG